MSEFEFTYDLDAVTRITANAVGQPGQRVFYIQARSNRQLISMIAEKDQVAALAQAINQLLDDLAEKNPLLSSADDLLPVFDMSLEEPLEPVFRIAQLRLGYDEEDDTVVLVALGWPESEGVFATYGALQRNAAANAGIERAFFSGGFERAKNLWELYAAD